MILHEDSLARETIEKMQHSVAGFVLSGHHAAAYRTAAAAEELGDLFFKRAHAAERWLGRMIRETYSNLLITITPISFYLGMPTTHWRAAMVWLKLQEPHNAQ